VHRGAGPPDVLDHRFGAVLANIGRRDRLQDRLAGDVIASASPA
jgi:hypothetical protein